MSEADLSLAVMTAERDKLKAILASIEEDGTEEHNAAVELRQKLAATRVDKAELVEALSYLAGECHIEMDEDYNPHARPLARAIAVLAKHRED